MGLVPFRRRGILRARQAGGTVFLHFRALEGIDHSRRGQYFPAQIDDALKRHPLVQFAMAVPFDNRYYGEEIAAYVVLRDGVPSATETALLEHCRRLLPFSKSPKVILFGQDAPYTSTGKPKRLELKTRLASTLAAYRDRQFKEE